MAIASLARQSSSRSDTPIVSHFYSYAAVGRIRVTVVGRRTRPRGARGDGGGCAGGGARGRRYRGLPHARADRTCRARDAHARRSRPRDGPAPLRLGQDGRADRRDLPQTVVRLKPDTTRNGPLKPDTTLRGESPTACSLRLWLTGQSPQVKAAVAGYFRDPGVFETTRGGGVRSEEHTS